MLPTGYMGEAEGAVRTLDGELVEDEFVSDAINYRFSWGRLTRCSIASS